MNTKNIKDEYLNAAWFGENLLGEIVWIAPQKQKAFLEKFGHLNVPMDECFHVTDVRKIFKERCSIIRGTNVYEVDPAYFLVRNPDYKPYG